MEIEEEINGNAAQNNEQEVDAPVAQVEGNQGGDEAEDAVNVEHAAENPAAQSDWDRAINEPDPEKRSFIMHLLMDKQRAEVHVEVLKENVKAIRSDKKSPAPVRAMAAQPSKFDGKDKKLTFKTWAASTKHYLEVKGQPEHTHVKSAATWLIDEPGRQTHLLFTEYPAEEWEYSEWVDAMQKRLFQIDPVHTARMAIHQAELKDVKEFPAFANTFTSNVALLSTENQPMAEADQVLHFRSALKSTYFYNQTSVDSLTNKPFATLSALLDKCRALYESRQAAMPARLVTLKERGSGSSRGGLANRGPFRGGRSGGGRFGGGGPYRGGRFGGGRYGGGRSGSVHNGGYDGEQAAEQQLQEQRTGAAQEGCFRCGKYGHQAAECPNPKKRKRQDSVSEADAFLAHLPAFSEPPFDVNVHPSHKPHNPKVVPPRPIKMPEVGDRPSTRGRVFQSHASPELMLSRAEIRKLENMVGHKFDMTDTSASGFLRKDLAGTHVFVWPEPSEIGAVTAHYQECKKRAPTPGSLCIIVPQGHVSELFPMLDGFQRLTQYSAGTYVLEERYANGIAMARKLSLGAQVFYDGAPVARSGVNNSDGTLKMRCVGQVAAERANVLLDSGARGSYISTPRR